MMRSPSQCPGIARSSPSAGRSLNTTSAVTCLRPRGLRLRRRVRLRTQRGVRCHGNETRHSAVVFPLSVAVTQLIGRVANAPGRDRHRWAGAGPKCLRSDTCYPRCATDGIVSGVRLSVHACRADRTSDVWSGRRDADRRANGRCATQASRTTGTIIGLRLVSRFTKRPAARRAAREMASMSLVSLTSDTAFSTSLAHSASRPSASFS